MRMKIYIGLSAFGLFLSLICTLPSLAQSGAPRGSQSPAWPLVFDRVRFLPAPKAEQAMVGGVFSGSNTSATQGFEPLAEIKAVPPAGQWTELKFDNKRPYRWIRYEGPRGSYGRVSKIEFYAGKERLTGPIIAPFMSSKWSPVVTDKPSGGVAGLHADGQYVGIDVGEKAACPKVIIRPGGGEFPQAIAATMQCKLPGAVICYTLDGTPPTRDGGQIYSTPLAIDKTTTLRAASFREGLAPSPDADAVLLLPPIGQRTTLHLGNSLTGNAVGKFALHVRTTGVVDDVRSLLMGGGIARTLWNSAMIGPGDPSDQQRWKNLFTTTHSMGGVITYKLDQVEKAAADWKKLWPSLTAVSDVTFQPRDADIAEEADYTNRWLKLVREKFPEVQPWLYIEWTEMERQRATDKGLVPSSQMQKLYPALTWEESMSAMMLYGEEVQRAMIKAYSAGKRPRIIPAALALGWIHEQIETGKFPGVAKDDFYPLLFSDRVHLNPEGSFLVEAVWYAAMYGQSPVGKLLPLQLQLTPQQTLAIQHLAWNVVQNYPDCGLYAEGTQSIGEPRFAILPNQTAGITRVRLASSSPGAWFRYTLDGTQPTRTRGYIYCGALSVPQGATLKAVAYQSGHADSAVSTAALSRNQ